MKYFLVAALIVFVNSTQSFASGFALFGANARFTKDTVGEFELEAPILIMGGYKHAPWMFSGEVLHYQDSSSEGGLTVENKHFEVTAYASYFIDYEEDRFLNPYVTFGLGAFKNYLEYDLSGSKYKDDSLWEPILKVGGGLWSEISQRFIINFEGKGLYSDKINPEFTLEVAVRLGLLF